MEAKSIESIGERELARELKTADAGSWTLEAGSWKLIIESGKLHRREPSVPLSEALRR